MSDLHHGELTEKIISSAVQVHRALGPGLLESAYEACLCHELTCRGIALRRQVELPIRYDGVLVDAGYRIDLVVEDRVVVELKSIDQLAPIHEAQLLTYLRLSGYPVGLLINFYVIRLIDGVVRRVMTKPPSAPGLTPRPPRPPRPQR